MRIFFSDYFGVTRESLAEYGAFNSSLINDLPLFIDPFLLFTSEKQRYRQLHDEIITYLRFLRDQSALGTINEGLLKSWYMFPEVKQLWLGFSKNGNRGSGLGLKFAKALNENLHVVFKDFGDEKIAKGSHIEKVCLICDGVGRDNISDFTANLIKGFLLEYTEEFAKTHIAAQHRKVVSVEGARFDYATRYWCPKEYDLPYSNGDFVLLSPRDLLTRDENWINRGDMLNGVERIARACSNGALRAMVNDYLTRNLNHRSTKQEQRRVCDSLIKQHPQLIEWYIKCKEDTGEKARTLSDEKVSESEEHYINSFGKLIRALETETEFYKRGVDTYQESMDRVKFLKDEIENNDGYRYFYHKNKPFMTESDLQILFRLTWYSTPSDFNSEVNNGRGPVDFKISRGSKDKTLVEFKLASNSKLQANLDKQVEVYEAANKTRKSIKVIFFFSAQEERRLRRILRILQREHDESIVLIDCRNDNKPSASNAK